MTLTELKALFRRWVKVLPGGPTDKTRGAGMLTILDALATEIVNLPLGTTVVRLDIPGARQRLANAAPDPQVVEAAWHTIDGDWNATGTDARVFVWGLSGNKFSPVGLLRDALGKDSFVEVDVVAGTAVAASGRVPAVWELQEEGAPKGFASLEEACAKGTGYLTLFLLRNFYGLTANTNTVISNVVGNKAFINLNGFGLSCQHAPFNDVQAVDFGPIPATGGVQIGDGGNAVWAGGQIRTALHLDLGIQIFDGVTIEARQRAGAAYAVTTNNAGTKIILRGGSTLTGTVDPRITVIDQNAGSGPPPDLSAYAKTTDVNTLVGTLTNLATAAKNNVVAAINELAGRAIARYYTALGTQTDGALTVKAATDALATKGSATVQQQHTQQLSVLGAQGAPAMCYLSDGSTVGFDSLDAALADKRQKVFMRFNVATLTATASNMPRGTTASGWPNYLDASGSTIFINDGVTLTVPGDSVDALLLANFFFYFPNSTSGTGVVNLTSARTSGTGPGQYPQLLNGYSQVPLQLNYGTFALVNGYYASLLGNGTVHLFGNVQVGSVATGITIVDHRGGGSGGTAYTGAGRIKVNGTVISYEQEADVYSTSLVAGNQPQGVFPALGSNSDGAIVLFDTVTRDPGHNANLAGSYYTVPVTGYYFIVTKVRIADNAPAGKRWAQWPALLGDDSSQARVDTTGPQWSSLENTWQPHLTAGQRVYCRVFLDGFTAGAAATMEVRLLRADS